MVKSEKTPKSSGEMILVMIGVLIKAINKLTQFPMEKERNFFIKE